MANWQLAAAKALGHQRCCGSVSCHTLGSLWCTAVVHEHWQKMTRQSSAQYGDRFLDSDRWTSVATLKSMLGSQCSRRSTGKMWSQCQVPVTSRPAGFWTDWNRLISPSEMTKNKQHNHVSDALRLPSQTVRLCHRFHTHVHHFLFHFVIDIWQLSKRIRFTQVKNPPPPEIFWHFFPNNWEFLAHDIFTSHLWTWLAYSVQSENNARKL